MKKEYKKTKAFIYLLISIILYLFKAFFTILFGYSKPSPGDIPYIATDYLSIDIRAIVILSILLIFIIYLIIKSISFFIKTIKNKNYLYSIIMILSILLLMLNCYNYTHAIYKYYKDIVSIKS